ncbi:MAG: hypothetical protein ACI8WB_000522 [Phenylobacterium sp.]|jgi:hypothetical protein
MPVNIEDRPIETVREEVIDQLIMNYGHAEISLEAFERRLDQAMDSKCTKELAQLTADLDLKVDQGYIDSKNQDIGSNYRPGNAEEEDRIISILGNSGRSGPWKVAKQTNLLSIFADTKIDFTDAQFSQAQSHIKIFSLFASCKIYIPENIHVVSKTVGIFGSVHYKPSSKSTPKPLPNAPTLYVEGYSIFSDVNIEIKRTIKERFLTFADGLKRMLS